MDFNKTSRGKVIFFVDTEPGTVIKITIINSSKIKLALVAKIINSVFDLMSGLIEILVLIDVGRTVALE